MSSKQENSSSDLKLPKLHIWTRELIPAIKQFGVSDAFTADTMESKHIDAVSKPFALTNKRPDAVKQVAKLVRRADLLGKPAKELPQIRPSQTRGFLFAITPSSTAVHDYQRASTYPNPNSAAIFATALSQLKQHLNPTSISFWNTASLEDGTNIHASPDFHGRPYFDTIKIRVERGLIDEDAFKEGEERFKYAKLEFLWRIVEGAEGAEGADAAVVRYFRFVDRDNPRLLGYPYVAFRPENEAQMAIIPLDRIVGTTHAVQDFKYEGERWFIRHGA